MVWVWRFIRFSMMSVLFVSTILVITSCTESEQLTAFLLILALFLTGGGEAEAEVTVNPFSIGADPTQLWNGNVSAGRTCIDVTSPATGSGTLQQVQFRLGSPQINGILKVKIFRPDGAGDWDFIAEDTTPTFSGNTTDSITVSVSIPGVQAGDLIGYFADVSLGTIMGLGAPQASTSTQCRNATDVTSGKLNPNAPPSNAQLLLQGTGS